MDSVISEGLFRIGKQKIVNNFAPKYEDSLKNTDAIINNISGEGYVKKHSVSGLEVGIPKQQIISVFDSK